MSLPVKLDKTKPLIRDLKNEVPIEQTLILIYAKTGLKINNYPSKEDDFNEHKLLIKHIEKNYRTIRVEEILIAFDMALSGRLKVDVQHYQNFSCEYFSRIVNAYQQWKVPFSRQQTKQIETKNNQQTGHIF